MLFESVLPIGCKRAQKTKEKQKTRKNALIYERTRAVGTWNRSQQF
jgi:hypothetical protein